jgi:hypothetical protein
MTKLLLVAFIASCALLAVPAVAQESSWSLLTADLATEPVVLKSMDAAGLKVTPAGGGDERAVPLDRFVELTRTLAAPGTPAGKFDLHLTTGDRLNGDPAGVKGENIVWKTGVIGEVNVPLRQLASLTKAGVKPPGDERRKEDVVTFANKDMVRGVIAGLTATSVALQTDVGPQEIPLANIESVAFATTAAAAAAQNREGYRVRLDDGSSVVGTAVKVAADKVELTLGPGAGGTRQIDVARVAGIEHVNGPVSWLSSRTPSESVYLPFLGSSQTYPARMNRNYRGDPIFVKDRRYERGIGVHSYSKLVYPLDGKTFAAFRTGYAIDGNPERADVTVRVKLDDKVVHEQQNVRAGSLSPVVVVDLAGAKELTLEVDFGANIDSEDRLNWIEPALLKVKPAAPATQPAAAGAE